MNARENRPWSAQIELVEGCSRLCTFCGLNGIRNGPGDYRFMSERTAGRAAEQLALYAPDVRVEFAMHGEPLMHPQYLERIALFRGMLPRSQFQVTTNGVRFLGPDVQERVEGLFAVGVDFIVLDTYYPERDRLIQQMRTLVNVAVRDFYTELAPVGWSPWTNHHRKVSRTIVLMDDLGSRDGEVRSRTVLNHAGNNPTRPIPLRPLRRTCTIPFREVAIRWDGKVAICCMDWRGEYICGDVNVRSLRSIWEGPEFRAARAMLQDKDRNFDPCAKCDAGAGPRAGLLPKLPRPTFGQRQLVRQVNERA